MSNVRDFLINEKGLMDSTYKNSYNLLRRILLKINGNNIYLLNDIKVIESKNTIDKIFLNNEDKKEYLNILSQDNDNEIIILHFLLFIIGFNINEVGIIQVKNFINNFTEIKIRRNLKFMKRKVDQILSNVFKLHIAKNEFLLNDFFLYPSIKNTKLLTRTKFLEERFKNFINLIKSISSITKNNLINNIHKEKPRKSLCLEETLILKNIEINYYNNESYITESKNKIFAKSNDDKNQSKMLTNNIFKDKNLLKIDDSISLNAPNYDLYNNDLYYSGEINIKNDKSLFFDSFDSYKNKNDFQNYSLNYAEEDSWKNDLIKFKFNNPFNISEEEKNKNVLFKLLKRFKINFNDDPLGNDDSLIYIHSRDKGTYIELLEKDNYNIYQKMKQNSLNGIYPNLKLLELKTDVCIQTTQNIEKNTLLFEIGGEIITNSKLNEIYPKFENKYWCNFNYFNSSKYEDNKIILNNVGNIAFFIQPSGNYRNNIDIKAFKLKENEKIFLLVYSIKKILKGDILINNKKLTKI